MEQLSRVDWITWCWFFNTMLVNTGIWHTKIGALISSGITQLRFGLGVLFLSFLSLPNVVQLAKKRNTFLVSTSILLPQMELVSLY